MMGTRMFFPHSYASSADHHDNIISTSYGASISQKSYNNMKESKPG